MHTHISALHAFIALAYLVVLLGTARLIALRFQGQNVVADAWLTLF